ncbi:tungstate ABC transporter substrate-binding protein WtpA [Candidatus Bathyarchaeota archaeon]|nr:MAG: tungstate ABC transporter substrate-binding protein WtpA [Candidatus Bathyarchaeota archaeon]
MKLKSLTILTIITVIIITGAIFLHSMLQQQKIQIKVFHAGSLTIPLEEVKKLFEKKNPHVEVQLESSGSLEAIRKITELNKKAEVVAVADWLLLKNIMYPKFTDFYIKFATNNLVIAYTNKSKYADEINNQNWYQILMYDDVCFAFSDPNKDPCGYRALIMLVLAQLYYDKPNLFKKLIETNTNIKLETDSNHYIILVPPDLAPTTDKVKIRPKSVELLALLEEGIIDYAFEYRSVAVQHNLHYVELPSSIHLGDLNYEDFYKQVLVKINAGSSKEKMITASPIIYGVTIPKNAQYKKLAIEFIQLMLSEEGKEIFRKNGQPPLKTALGYGKIPDVLISFVEKSTIE